MCIYIFKIRLDDEQKIHVVGCIYCGENKKDITPDLTPWTSHLTSFRNEKGDIEKPGYLTLFKKHVCLC